MTKGIIFRSDKNLVTSKFTDFEGSDIAKLDDRIFIVWWHDETSHESVINKYQASEVEAFASSVVNGKIDFYDIDRLTKYASYKPTLRIALTKYYRG